MLEKKLYDYQLDCLELIDLNERGIINLPTGTGKTYIQAHAIVDDILKNNKNFGMYVINAPRIMLSFQLLKEVYAVLVKLGIEAKYVCVHSGGDIDKDELEEIRINSNFEVPFSKIISTTSSIVIKQSIDDAMKLNVPLIFFSTYNSSERIEIARKKYEPIRLIMNDEAHYLVQVQFHDSINSFTANKVFFFTATLKNSPSDKGLGMNNIDVYGEILYSMTPRDAINRGKMLRPRLHFVIPEDKKNYDLDDLQKSVGKIIHEGFKQHKYVLDCLRPKMMVSVNGTMQIKNFMESCEYKKLIKSGVNIYCIASDKEISNDINGVKYTRYAFLEKLKKDGEDPLKEMIVLHYDILTEGIDIPGLTGVILFRILSLSKLIQILGRVSRLCIEDRYMIESGKIGVHDLDKMEKPFAWVIIPTIVNEDVDNKYYIEKLIDGIRDYGFVPSEDIVTSSNSKGGLKIEEGVDALKNIKNNTRNLGEVIERVEAEYEDERIASLSMCDIVKEDWFLEI